MRWLIFLIIFALAMYAVDQIEEVWNLKKINSTVEDSLQAVEYINELRAKNGLKPIKWDERAYDLAMYRAKDMVDKKYFAHKSPSGESVFTLKEDFGFASNERLCENIYMESYENYPLSLMFRDYYTGVEEKAIDGWMDSPPHRHILMHPELKGGAVACYEACCVFVGVGY